MKTDNWKYFYKINPENDSLIETNLIYTPLVSPDGKIFCMDFNHTSSYQTTDIEWWLPKRPHYTKEMVKFFFNREVKYLSCFIDEPWAPKYIKVEFETQRIFFEFSGETCNNIIYSGRQLEDYCPDWQIQMRNIIVDIVNSGHYKTSLYPHCYFIDNGVLRTFDFYGCVGSSKPYVKLDDIRGMIGETSGPRFMEATEGELLNIEILFKRALAEYVKWPSDILPTIYKELFDE
jgi:hypothetical protein